MSNNANSVVIGQYTQDVRLCGYRRWPDYQGKNGPVKAGGTVVVRRDDVDRTTGEKVHNVEEHRVPVEFLDDIAGLPFGAPLRLGFETHKSTRVGSDRVWSVLVDVQLPQPAKS